MRSLVGVQMLWMGDHLRYFREYYHGIIREWRLHVPAVDVSFVIFLMVSMLYDCHRMSENRILSVCHASASVNYWFLLRTTKYIDTLCRLCQYHMVQ